MAVMLSLWEIWKRLCFSDPYRESNISNANSGADAYNMYHLVHRTCTWYKCQEGCTSRYILALQVIYLVTTCGYGVYRGNLTQVDGKFVSSYWSHQMMSITLNTNMVIGVRGMVPNPSLPEHKFFQNVPKNGGPIHGCQVGLNDDLKESFSHLYIR